MLKLRTILPYFFLFFTGIVNAQIEFEIEEIEVLPESINSPYEESSPVYDHINERLYFTRTLHPDNSGGVYYGQDMWYTDFVNDKWSTPLNDLNKLNNYLNNSAIGISEDGGKLYLKGSYVKKINLQDGFSIADRSAEGWERPDQLEISGLNIKSDFYGGFVNRAEDVMVISMNSYDALGEEDLYVTRLIDGEWTKPLWLGDSINSEGFEISPFLFDDGKTLLFASNGLGGLGDADLFYSYRLDSTWTRWSKPVNLGAPVNSSAFDAFPFGYNELLFFSSNREDSLSNIYSAINSLYYREADTVRLVFESFDTRMTDVEAVVIDKLGDTIGVYKTDRFGVMRIPELREKQDYRIIPMHESVDMTLFKPLMIKQDGSYLAELEFDEEGSLRVQPATADQVAAAPSIPAPVYVSGMQGIFEVDRVPLKGTILALQDSEGRVYQYARTAEGGKFRFAETPDSLDLNIQVISELEYVKKNGVIYYTDNQGRKLFKSMASADGSFTYQKIQAKELTQMKSLLEKDTKLQTSSSGVFKYENLPQAGVKLALYDENNNLVEEVITDEDGNFVFNKLRPDKNFRIAVAGEDESQEGSLVFFDDDGNEIDYLTSVAGGFNYQSLNPDLIKGMKLLEEEDEGGFLGQNFVFSVGLFKYQSLPKEGVTLKLLDMDGNVLEVVTSDGNGNFVFSMLEPSKDYRIQVVGIDDPKLEQSQLYFVDRNGNVTTARLENGGLYNFKKLDSEYFFTMNQVNEEETEMVITQSFRDVQGQFKYENIAKSGVQIELLDENNKLIETVYTDSEGNFRFSKLAKESNYFVRLSESDASLIDNASFKFTNEDDQELLTQTSGDSEFAFMTLPRSSALQRGLIAEDDPTLIIDGLLPAGAVRKAPVKSTSSPNDEKNDLKMCKIWFNFNSIRISNNDRYHLNHDVYQKVKHTNQPILIVGQTCDLGEPEVNRQISLMRANAVKNYLVELGLDPGLIEVHALTPGDGTKMTYGERLDNRKVEIYHLTP